MRGGGVTPTDTNTTRSRLIAGRGCGATASRSGCVGAGRGSKMERDLPPVDLSFKGWMSTWLRLRSAFLLEFLFCP